MTLTTQDQNPALVRDIQRLRKTLFVDVLNWDLRTEGDFERDQFDTAHTVHAALSHGSEIVGCFRAVRCDRPYLGAELFPRLATEQPYPRSAQSWEISRFGVTPHRDRRQQLVTARANYACMFRFAQLRQAESLVAIADLTYERFLGSLGIATERFGPPRQCATDALGRPLTLVAGQIPIACLSGARFRELMSCLTAVEIIDETRLLGPAAISA